MVGVVWVRIIGKLMGGCGEVIMWVGGKCVRSGIGMEVWNGVGGIG